MLARSLAASIFGALIASTAFAQETEDMSTGASPALLKATANETVQTGNGPVRGKVDGATVSFLGIPYAAPPVGDLRWRPPRKPAQWSEPLDATRFAQDCPQNADLGVFGRAGGKEDCLYLNVVRANGVAGGDTRLPVLVWIHGGSLWVGSAGHYDATKLALDGEAVIVTLNYRLGLLGLFAHPELGGNNEQVANYGLMDQAAALEWVQENIAAFGGDPGNVTIFGESSGGGSVLAHVASPTSAGRFQHAIAMSGAAVALKFPAFGAPRPLDDAQRTGEAFAQAVGCGAKGADCLRSLSQEAILAAQTPYLLNQFVIDGTVLPVAPVEAFRSGAVNRVTLINGHTRDEGLFFAGLRENATGEPFDPASFRAAVTQFYGGSLAPRILDAYRVEDYLTPSEAYGAAMTSSLFACPGRAIDRMASKLMPTYAYEFSDRTAPSYLGPTSYPTGAAHTLELPYLFPAFRGGDGEGRALNALQARLSDEMVRLWSQAGKAGEREASWPRYEVTRDNLLSLVLPDARMRSKAFDVHKCDFWDSTGLY